jgi:uncharacterized protein
MAARMMMFKVYLIIFTVLIDIYVFGALFALFKNQGQGIVVAGTIGFWTITTAFLLAFILLFRFESGDRNPAGLSSVFLLVGIFILVYLPKLVFICFRGTEDLIWLGSWLAKWIAGKAYISSLLPLRLPVISQTGLVISVVPFLAILWGLAFGRFHYQVEEVEMKFSSLPAELDGLTMVQLSDIHLGSLYGKKKQLQKAVDIVNSFNPDLILFTGDLVNNFTEEAHGWETVFAGLKAGYGKYSILGNHDYGDYWEWKSMQEKTENLKMLYDVHRAMGFRLLTNACDTVRIRGGMLAIIGVENWGQPPFKQYGDLKKAMEHVPDDVFKILLSHDPTHWDAQVFGQTDIPLTLSGHTHGMQFGIKLGNFRWSPSKYIYRRWMGLYRQNGQALYVNRGLGFIGFPGRIGLRPEITRITLKKAR